MKRPGPAVPLTDSPHLPAVITVRDRIEATRHGGYLWRVRPHLSVVITLGDRFDKGCGAGKFGTSSVTGKCSGLGDSVFKSVPWETFCLPPVPTPGPWMYSGLGSGSE